jgi:hypothetical protein
VHHDDRELQTEQTIIRLPARNLQPDRMDAVVVRNDRSPRSRLRPERKGSDRIARSMRLRNDLIDEKYVIIGDMIRSGQGLPAANPLKSIRLRNEIAATAKSRIWQNLFSALLHFMRPEAEHPNLPRPVVKVIPSISNFSLNSP